VAEIRQEPVWLPPRQMPQMAPLLARRLLSINASDKIVSTLDPSLQRELESLALNVKNQLPPRTSLAMLVVDHSKFGRNAMVNLGNMSLLDYLYTDKVPPASVMKVIEQHEVHLELC